MDPLIKATAKEMYVVNGLSMKSIETILAGKVTKKTLYNWKDSGEWDKERTAKIDRRANIRERMEALLERAITECETNFNSNNMFAVGKAAEAVKKAVGMTFSDEKNERLESLKKGFSPENLEKIEQEMSIL